MLTLRSIQNGNNANHTIQCELPEDQMIFVEDIYDRATSLYEGQSGTRSNGSLAYTYHLQFEEAESEQDVQVIFWNSMY